ncbi:MAG: hypothetical protein IMF01_02320, partial [Proteobacteria bacterium]|nr:hypothetical protein [Pseudomonadota bacterium]
MEDVYFRLANHLKDLIMGYPFNDGLLDLLKKMFNPIEAQVALAIPNNLAPLEVVDLETIAVHSELPLSTVVESLDSLSSSSMLYTAPTESGAKGYALLQVGYGMPQTFFWEGRKDDHVKEMAKVVLKYFSVQTTRQVYGGVPTKTYK